MERESILVGFSPKCHNMSEKVEQKRLEMLKKGYKMESCTLMTSSNAILDFIYVGQPNMD